MKLSTARAIHTHAQKTPLIRIGKTKSDEFGSSANFEICGDNMHYYLQGSVDGSKWWVAHSVYGGSYAEGSTKKEAVLAFARKLKWLPEEKKKRKLAARIVEKYGIGPIIEQNDRGTWVATLEGKVIAKAATYMAAKTMADRFEKSVA